MGHRSFPPVRGIFRFLTGRQLGRAQRMEGGGRGREGDFRATKKRKMFQTCGKRYVFPGLESQIWLLMFVEFAIGSLSVFSAPWPVVH